MTAGHCVADTDPDCGPDALSGKPPTCTPGLDPGGDGTSHAGRQRRRRRPRSLNAVRHEPGGGDRRAGGQARHQLRWRLPGRRRSPLRRRLSGALLARPARLRSRSPAPDEGALWDPDSAEEISGWGSTSESGSPVDTLRAASVNVIPDSTCSGRLRQRLRPGHDGLRGIPERRRGHLLRRQRRTAGGAAPGRRLPGGRDHGMGLGLCRGRLPGRLYAGRGPDHAVADLVRPLEPRRFAPPAVFGSGGQPRASNPTLAGLATKSVAAEEVQAHPQPQEAEALPEEGPVRLM